MPRLFDRVAGRRPAWLKRWERPAQEHPAPRIALASLLVGGLLLVIGSLLPWSDRAVPIIETVNGQEMVTGVQTSRPSGVSDGSGGITLGLGIVLIGLASLLWQRGLRDVVGFGLPFLAAIAVVVAGLKFNDISDTVRYVGSLNAALERAGESEAFQIRWSVGSGLYVALVGAIIASLGALRVSMATRKAGKAERAGEERPGRARPRRR